MALRLPSPKSGAELFADMLTETVLPKAGKMGRNFWHGSNENPRGLRDELAALDPRNTVAMFREVANNPMDFVQQKGAFAPPVDAQGRPMLGGEITMVRPGVFKVRPTSAHRNSQGGSERILWHGAKAAFEDADPRLSHAKDRMIPNALGPGHYVTNERGYAQQFTNLFEGRLRGEKTRIRRPLNTYNGTIKNKDAQKIAEQAVYRAELKRIKSGGTPSSEGIIRNRIQQAASDLRQYRPDQPVDSMWANHPTFEPFWRMLRLPGVNSSKDAHTVLKHAGYDSVIARNDHTPGYQAVLMAKGQSKKVSEEVAVRTPEDFGKRIGRLMINMGRRGLLSEQDFVNVTKGMLPRKIEDSVRGIELKNGIDGTIRPGLQSLAKTQRQVKHQKAVRERTKADYAKILAIQNTFDPRRRSGR